MKIAVVTGASSGIGLASARLLAQNGFLVYALSRRGGEDETLMHLSCDVTDEAAVQRTMAQIVEAEGHIDLLVNNAGFGISGAVECTDDAQAKKQFDVNFFGAFHCSKAVIPYMREAGGGRIINISSMAAVLSIPFQSFYSASKSAINSLTLALANEVRPFGITVCALMPGDVKTGFTAVREKDTSGDAIYGETLKKSIATMEHDEQTGMAPEQLAEAVLKLATKKRVKPISSCGAQYRLFAVLGKVLPVSVVNAIIERIYA